MGRHIPCPVPDETADENFNIRPGRITERKWSVSFSRIRNAPTAWNWDRCHRRHLTAQPGSIVIVDEAYVDFGATSALPLLEKYDNLIVVRTFSKSRSMAGMRIGYAIAASKVIRYLNDVKYSFQFLHDGSAVIDLGVEAVKTMRILKKTSQRSSTQENAAKSV